MQWHTFNILLIALSVYDIVFLLCSLVVYAVPAIEIQSILDLTQTWAFAHVYKAVFYPFTTIAYSGGVYLTTAITVERYVCKDTYLTTSLSHSVRADVTCCTYSLSHKIVILLSRCGVCFKCV